MVFALDGPHDSGQPGAAALPAKTTAEAAMQAKPFVGDPL
jgi:hypothetical protein